MSLDKPSTYTPLLRRFGPSERDREIAETRERYARVRAMHAAFAHTHLSIAKMLTDALPEVPEALAKPLSVAIFDLIDSETCLWSMPDATIEQMSLEQFVRFRNFLAEKEHILVNQEHFVDFLAGGLLRILEGLLDALPDMQKPTPFTIALVHTLNEPRDNLDRIIGTLFDYNDDGVFRSLNQQLYQNLCSASGIAFTMEPKKPLTPPSASALPIHELPDAYFSGTPFRDLLLAPVPLAFPTQTRFRHTHILGGSGAGKTTLIEKLILHDLAQPEKPSVIVIDPHSDLVERLGTADLGIADRIIRIDPRDIENPPALNVFAVNQDRMGGYSPAMQEQITASVIETFDYLFSGLLGADLTAKQSVFFRYLARLMLALPGSLGRNATILDMLHLMQDSAPYVPAIQSLPPIPRDFFLHDFTANTFKQTREQIRYRLQSVIENPTLARLFTQPEKKLDLLTEINSGAVILVDTARDFLKGNSAILGRIFISLVLQAVLERAAMPERERRPVFLYIDEAGSYFDSNIDDLLTEARKQKCAVTLSHQYMDQATGALRSSLAANTGIKFASGLSASDARAMAADMRTTSDFILSQPPLSFAAYIAGHTPHAVSIPIEPRKPLPQLSPDALSAQVLRNRDRLCSRQVASPHPPATDHGGPGDDASTGW